MAERYSAYSDDCTARAIADAVGDEVAGSALRRHRTAVYSDAGPLRQGINKLRFPEAVGRVRP